MLTLRSTRCLRPNDFMKRMAPMLTKPDDYKAKAEEYKRLAEACVDPEEKKKLEKLEQDCCDLALAAQ